MFLNYCVHVIFKIFFRKVVGTAKADDDERTFFKVKNGMDKRLWCLFIKKCETSAFRVRALRNFIGDHGSTNR